MEEGTIFGKQYDAGKLLLPSENIEREMYYLLKGKLKEAGYNQYEISNFSLKNYESKHNIAYWKRQDYLGLGSNSASCIKNVRFSNEESIEKYIELINNNKSATVYEEKLNEEAIFVEKIILGLRLLEGINYKQLLQGEDERRTGKFLTNKEFLLKMNLIEENGDIIRLTSKGLDLANQVFIKFMDLS